VAEELKRGDELIRLENVKKYFQANKALREENRVYIKAVDGVSLSLRYGETFGLVGESGCGKSTLGQTILRLEDPTDGAIYYRGTDIAKLSSNEMRPYRREMQIIFQDPYSSLDPKMTVGAIIAEPLIVHKMGDAKERERRVAELLKLVGLRPEHAKRYPHEFSGGQRQRIGIARALAVNPKFVICDEAVSALDVSIQAQVLNLLRRLQKELGLTYLFIAHGLAVVKYISDRVGVMYLGKIVESGPAATIYADPEHPYTNGLMHSVHKIGSRKKERLFSIEGTVPLAMNLKTACGFYERCDHRIEGLCDQADPELVEVAPDHKVACFACDNEACRAMRAKAEAMLKAQGQQGASKEEKRHE
jgi:oligopeptide transport system ATP-binding protein